MCKNDTKCTILLLHKICEIFVMFKVVNTFKLSDNKNYNVMEASVMAVSFTILWLQSIKYYNRKKVIGY